MLELSPMKTLSALVFLLALFVGACGKTDCRKVCDKLNACGAGSSGFSCSASCSGDELKCAECLDAKSCTEIRSNACAAPCPNYRPNP